MSDTINYYDQNADQFFVSTVDVDMTSVYERFLMLVPDQGRLLDAGCGSGRDTLAFKKLGYVVDAFDASEELVKRARNYSGVDVGHISFQQFNCPPSYNGIWACASLLHLKASEIPDALNRLWKSLTPSGVLYVSFKLGIGERLKSGRHFTDLDTDFLKSLFKRLPELAHLETWITKDQREDRIEQWINGIAIKKPIPAKKLSTGGDNPFLPRLVHEMAKATHIDISVSFIRATGLELLLPDLRAALSPDPESLRLPAKIRILTCDYLDITDIESCRLLMLLQEEGAEVRIFQTNQTSFHMKAYIFSIRNDEQGYIGTAYIGSSNISRMALREGLEWNYKVEYPEDHGYLEAAHQFNDLFRHPETIGLSHQWIDQYKLRRRVQTNATVPDITESEEIPTPTPIQLEALKKLAETRADQYKRGLVVLATGLGKTWLAAFDAQGIDAKKILFVAHREEILHQAADTFLRIRPESRVGYYTGKVRQNECDVLCASIQTIGRESHLDLFEPDHFDYIVVDEFHHASAPTYRRLLNYFRPSFLLGLTATPDRSDQNDILSLCDNNLVYTCDLFSGINGGYLAPFYYYGIFDEDIDYSVIPWRNGRFDPHTLSNKLATLGRANHALKEWRKLKQQKTLAFCVSVKHAMFMAEHFRKAGVSSEAAYAGSNIGRAEALSKLESGELQVLFSVDLFNEGMDLPAIDTIMFLRPTESKILFLQQLGRGLRKSEGKEKVVVLDFIGNHKSFLHKPQALFNIGGSYRELSRLAIDLQKDNPNLPEGCFVNYDLEIIEFLQSLNSTNIDDEVLALESTLGHRPTIGEAYQCGISITTLRRSYGSWFKLLNHIGKLEQNERIVLDEYEKLLLEFETTAMTKCFKMVLIEAFQELDGWVMPPTLEALSIKSWEVLARYPNLRKDLPERFLDEDAKYSGAWLSYWKQNPINAWAGNDRKKFFKVEGSLFSAKFAIKPESLTYLKDMVQEIIDYRLTSYEKRLESSNVTEIDEIGSKRISLPYFPNIKIACGHFKTGRADAEEYRTLDSSYGNLDPTRHFIAQASGNSMNGGKHPILDKDYLLLERISPDSAGSISNQIIAIERQDESGDDQYVLRRVIKTPDGRYTLRANNPGYEDFVAKDGMRPLARLKRVLDVGEVGEAL